MTAPAGAAVALGELAAVGGIELVKFFIILALQEARRAKMTPEQTEEAFSVAKEVFAQSDPDLIPDV